MSLWRQNVSCTCALTRVCSLAMSGHMARSPYGSWGPDTRLILVGNIGCGKTTSADTILGQLSPVSEGNSKSCQLRSGTFDRTSLTLVEAPRWYWSGGKMEESVRTETLRAMTLVEPGPHAILLLVPVNQFTEVGCYYYHLITSIIFFGIFRTSLFSNI